ncbi:Uncharacterised protein [Mycobacteroides abscessus subsp. massiliense]|nr:Uncharacterised protein [Mycobacteroides abscessus subsp. massiliense]
MLDTGDEGQLLHHHAIAQLLAAQLVGPLQHVCDVFDLRERGPYVQAVLLQEIPEHLVVSLGVHGLLAHEPDHGFADLVVLHVGQCTGEGVDEGPLAFGEKEIEGRDEVRHDGLVRNPVQRRVAGVELHIARPQHDLARLGGYDLHARGVSCVAHHDV